MTRKHGRWFLPAFLGGADECILLLGERVKRVVAKLIRPVNWINSDLAPRGVVGGQETVALRAGQNAQMG